MSNPLLMGRRQFLVLSSTCAAAAATVGPELFAAASVAPVRLAVGFKPLQIDSVVVAASGIPAGDGAFIGRGARVTALGASGASTDVRLRRTADLTAHFAYFDGAQRKTAPFVAWGCGHAGQSSPAGFTVPVDEVQKIVLTVGLERASAAPTTTSRRKAVSIGAAENSRTVLPLTLSLQNEDGAYRLARGFYVVVPMFPGDSDPRWSAWTIRAVEGRFALVDAAGEVAPFEHLVLRVDYAAS